VGKERPILFSGAMVRAILDGRKTQTRWVVKPQPKHLPMTNGTQWVDMLTVKEFTVMKCPYGAPCGQLWVKETWQSGEFARNEPRGAVYRATDPDWETTEGWKWKPSIFMPRSASRITLEITEVRVQRVQEITEDDAKAEGVERLRREEFRDYWYRNYGKPIVTDDTGVPLHYFRARDSFQSLWDSINAKRGYGWGSNPWCWCISFKAHRTKGHPCLNS
jgi:hypothetical protein